MEVALFFIGEEQVGHPDPVGLGQCQVFQLASKVVELKSLIEPLFSERQLYTVLLQETVQDA